MKYFSKKKEIKKNIVAVILFIFGFFMIFYLTLSSLGDVPKRDSFVFIFLFILIMIFSLVARWIVNGARDYSTGFSRENVKNVDKKNDSKIFIINIFKTSFHLLPLYFTLLLIKIDLIIYFKVILFALLIFLYMLVGLSNIWNRIINFSVYFSKKIKSRFLSVMIKALVPVVIIFATFYFVYSMIFFYIKKFS